MNAPLVSSDVSVLLTASVMTLQCYVTNCLVLSVSEGTCWIPL